MHSQSTVRPWLIVDEDKDSKEAQDLFVKWCDELGHECEVIRKDEAPDVRAAPTLVWMGTYEGLELIRRILRSSHIARRSPNSASA